MELVHLISRFVIFDEPAFFTNQIFNYLEISVIELHVSRVSVKVDLAHQVTHDDTLLVIRHLCHSLSVSVIS